MQMIENGVVHSSEEMTREKRYGDPHLDGTSLRFETVEHGGEYPDTMPQAIRLTGPQGRSCLYLPVRVGGAVLDSKGFELLAHSDEGSA